MPRFQLTRHTERSENEKESTKLKRNTKQICIDLSICYQDRLSLRCLRFNIYTHSHTRNTHLLSSRRVLCVDIYFMHFFKHLYFSGARERTFKFRRIQTANFKSIFVFSNKQVKLFGVFLVLLSFTVLCYTFSFYTFPIRFAKPGCWATLVSHPLWLLAYLVLLLLARFALTSVRILLLDLNQKTVSLALNAYNTFWLCVYFFLSPA